MVEIREWSEPADGFLSSFQDGNGTAIRPAALIVREDWHSGIAATPEAVISFRNAVAASCILPYRAQWQHHGWSGVWWSESFDHHPARLRPDGSKFDFRTPALNSIGFRLDGLQLHAGPRPFAKAVPRHAARPSCRHDPRRPAASPAASARAPCPRGGSAPSEAAGPIWGEAPPRPPGAARCS